MTVTSVGKLESLRSAYALARERAESARAELASESSELDRRAATADRLANRINLCVKLRQKAPMIGMGSFMVGITAVNLGAIVGSPWGLGIGLVGMATCVACIVGIETWKVKGPRLRAEHDGLLARHQSQWSLVRGKEAAHAAAAAEMARAEGALRQEEESIGELQRLLKPPTQTGVSEQPGAVVVGGVRIPKRLLPEKR